MAVYSYTKKVVTGPFGTTYDFTPADTKYTALGTVEDKSYVLIEDVSALPEQSAEINFVEDTLPSAIFDSLKDNKQAELSEYSSQFDDYKCNLLFVKSSLGFTANADIRSQTNIQGLISQFSTATATVQYKDYDNVMHKLTKAKLETLLSECVANALALYQQKWTLQNAIETATTMDELDAITIEFTMAEY